MATSAPPNSAEPTATTPAPLTWGLAIATYRRHDMLMQCVELALKQSRPPVEVVIADASPDWESGRQRLLRDAVPRFPDVRFVYEQARQPSAAVQRNQVVQASTADVLFLIDDDSLMFGDCAERVMAIYEADAAGRVAGVAIRETRQDPRHDPTPADQTPSAAAERAKRYGPVTRWVRRLLDADNLFVPYDDGFPQHDVPPAVQDHAIGRRELMAGKTMTVRRELAVREPFSELLARASSGEDSDMSYRVSRHGALLTALDARLFHVGSEGGRMNLYQSVALGALNPLVHHRLHSTDLDRSRKANRALLRRRLMIALLKDLRGGDWRLPQTRGIRLALTMLDRIFAMDKDELRRWYPGYQQQVINGSPTGQEPQPS